MRIEVANLPEVVSFLANQAPQALWQGMSDGLESSIKDVERDIAARTPVKSGAARSETFSRMTSALSAEAGFTLERAWYMRTLVFGAKAHPIFARGLRGSKESKAIAKHSRRHGVNVDWDVRLAVDAQLGDRAWFRVGRAPNLRKALLLPFGGGSTFRKMVMHPGITPQFFPAQSLANTEAQVVAAVSEGIMARLNEATP